MNVSNRKSHCGRKQKDYKEKIDNMRNILRPLRQTLTSNTAAAQIPKTTLWRIKQEGIVRVHNSTTKLLLTDNNMKEKVEFCLKHVYQLTNTCYTFDEMLETVPVVGFGRVTGFKQQLSGNNLSLLVIFL